MSDASILKGETTVNLEKKPRVLKGWTEEERKELEEAKYNGYPNAFRLIRGIVLGKDNIDHIIDRYVYNVDSSDSQLAKDIVDYYTGMAKFAEKKYVLETTTPHSEARTYIKRISWSTYGGVGVADEIETTSDRNEATVLSEDSIVKNLGRKYMIFAEPVGEASDNE